MGEDPISDFFVQGSLVLDQEARVGSALRNRMLTVIVLIVAAALGGGIMTFAIGLPSSPCAGIAGAIRSLTVVADINGFNDSVNHQQGSWPILTVHRCDIVKVTIVNGDTQAHGFAVDYYATRGTEIQGGQTLPVPPFLATKSGQFRVFCISFCTIHAFMQNGLLIVV